MTSVYFSYNNRVLNKVRLTFVISSLHAGGAERILSIMANYWAEKGYAISFITLDSRDNDFYILNPDIQRYALALLRGSNTPWGILRKHTLRLFWMRNAIKESRPDVVICFMDRMNVATLLATRDLKIPIIISERTEPRRQKIGPLWSLLRRLTYSSAQALVIQTESVKKWAANFCAANRLFVIPNPISVQDKSTIPDPDFDLPKQFIVSMGRMDKYKGFDLLIKAFSEVNKNGNWELILIGEGKERPNLRQLSEQLGISSIVHMPGRIKYPDSILSHAKIYVLSSLYEGFPNALLEAMRAGVAVISFDCPSGPAEIIRHGIDGILVPAQDSEALAQSMAKLMQDKNLRQSLACRAAEVTDRFSLEKIMRQWEDVIETVISEQQ